jgi:hypothetical protein
MSLTLKCLFEQLPSENIADLTALLNQHWHLQGAGQFIVSAYLAIEDSAVADGSRWRQPRYNNRLKALLSLEVRGDGNNIPALVPAWPLLGLYTVESTEVLSPKAVQQTSSDQRTPGSLQVCLFRLGTQLSRDSALRHWRQEHAAIACATQSTFGYRQHLITGSKNANSAAFDGLVEEYFPDGALSSAEVFFNAKNSQQVAEHIAALTDSSSHFIDMTSLLVNHLSEYKIDLTIGQ